MYSISLTGEIKSNFSWRVEILATPFPPKNVIFDPFSHVSPIISTGKTQNQPLALVGISYNFNVKIAHFARNRKVKNSLRRETLVSEIPARLSR